MGPQNTFHETVGVLLKHFQPQSRIVTKATRPTERRLNIGSHGWLRPALENLSSAAADLISSSSFSRASFTGRGLHCVGTIPELCAFVQCVWLWLADPVCCPAGKSTAQADFPEEPEGLFFGDRQKLSLETVLEGLLLEKLSLGGHGSLGSISRSHLVSLSHEGIS